MTGALFYAFKGTAEDMYNRSSYLNSKVLNVASNEQWMWLTSGTRNNLIIQGTDGDEEGNRVPFHWTTDGTIQHEIIGYTQTNGAKLAYDIESDFIKCLQKKCPLGVNLANQGLYRAYGCNYCTHKCKRTTPE